MTPADLEMWSVKMRALGVRAITTKEFSIELDPYHPEPIPPAASEDELSPTTQIPEGMCKRCGQNPPNSTFQHGICRECSALEMRQSVGSPS